MSKIEYMEGDSLLHRLDPRVKIMMLLLFTLVIFSTTNFFIIGTIFLIVLTSWIVSGIQLRTLVGFLRLMMVLIAIIIGIQAIFQTGETVLFGPVTQEGLFYGLLISFRLITLFMLMPLIIMTTQIYHIALGMVKMGLPYKVAYMATTALNMVPTLQNEIGVIMEAQKLRAFTVYEDGSIPQKLKAYPTLVIPLVIGTMRRAQQMGVAMDARSFACSKERTYIFDFEMSRSDKIIMTLLILLTVLMVYMNTFVL